MKLTIVEPDPLSNSNYLDFTPSVVQQNTSKADNDTILLGLLVIGLIVLYFVLTETDNNSTWI